VSFPGNPPHIMLSMKSKSKNAQKRSKKTQSKKGSEGWESSVAVQKAGDRKMTAFRTILQYPIGTTAFVGNVVSPQFGANSVLLSSLANYTAYTGLFDSYKFEKIEWTFTLRNTGTSGQFPVLVYYPDWDDTTVPTNLSAVASHPRAITKPFTPTNPTIKVCVEPKVALAAYNGLFTGYAQNSAPMWLDCASPNIAHYGLKWAIWNFADTTQSIDFSIKVWAAFREPV
jgi:hypothetical protein